MGQLFTVKHPHDKPWSNLRWWKEQFYKSHAHKQAWIHLFTAIPVQPDHINSLLPSQKKKKRGGPKKLQHQITHRCVGLSFRHLVNIITSCESESESHRGGEQHSHWKNQYRPKTSTFPWKHSCYQCRRKNREDTGQTNTKEMSALLYGDAEVFEP